MFSWGTQIFLALVQFAWSVVTYWGFILLMAFTIISAVYKSLHEEAVEDVIFIDLENENQFGNGNLGLFEIAENEDPDELPLFIRCFLDTVTEPLPIHDSI